MRATQAFASLLIVSLVSTSGQCAILFNTGANAPENSIPGALDPNWTIISGPDIVAPQPAVVTNPVPFAQSPNSSWVWVDQNGGGGVGEPYTFRLTFDLTGEDLTNRVLTGQWGVDNIGSIHLNGAPAIGTGALELPDVDVNNFFQFHAFTITGGFVSGLNTLDFVVTDAGNPGALNVTDLRFEAASAVPEPASMTLVGIGAAGLGLGALRRRRANKAADA